MRAQNPNPNHVMKRTKARRHVLILGSLVSGVRGARTNGGHGCVYLSITTLSVPPQVNFPACLAAQALETATVGGRDGNVGVQGEASPRRGGVGPAPGSPPPGMPEDSLDARIVRGVLGAGDEDAPQLLLDVVGEHRGLVLVEQEFHALARQLHFVLAAAFPV